MGGLIAQEFKTLIKSPASISILVIPLVLLVGLGYLLPSGWIVPSSITIGIVAAVLLYFGGSIEEIKRTSFMKSISLTRLSKLSFLATKILFAMVVSMISVMWVLFFSWVFTETGIAFLATDFSNLLVNTEGVTAIVATLPFEIDWQGVNWYMMLYAGIITIVVAVSLSFVFVAFAKSSLSFYLMSFGYLLAMILFGGVVMPGFLISEENEWFKTLYYFVPNYYTNNVMANSFSDGALAQIVETLEGGVGGLINVLVEQLYPILNIIDDGSLLEQIFVATNSNLGELLLLNIDPEIYASATQIEIDAVNSFIQGWNGKSTQLNNAYSDYVNLNGASAYIDAVYDLLRTPFDAGYSTWTEYFLKYSLDSVLNVVNINGAPLADLNIPALVIDVGGTSFGWSGGSLIEFIEWIPSLAINGALKDKIDPLINQVVLEAALEGVNSAHSISDKITSASIAQLFARLGLIEDANSFILGNISIDDLLIIEPLLKDPLLPYIVPIVEDVLINVIGKIAPDLAVSIENMYAPTDTFNLYVPWIEGALFLGVSVAFFKWS